MLRTLATVAAQSEAPDEVIIADDGSEPAAGEAFCDWANRNEFPVTHVWHPRGAYRAGEICNKAASVARGDYLLFIDQDCLLHRGTIAAWKRRLRPHTIQLGPRVHVLPPSSERFVPSTLGIARAGVRRHLRGVRAALRRARLVPEIPPVIESCNMLVPMETMRRSNGFDEAFRGWGYEDAEFFIRAVRSGSEVGLGGARTSVFHLYHPSRANEENRALFEERVSAKLSRCVQGLDRHNPAAALSEHRGRYRRVAYAY